MLKSRQGALGPRHVALAVLVLAFSLLSCGREITGPNAGLRFAKGLSFLSELPPPLASVAEGAGSVVAFDRVRVVFLRTLDEGIAFDRVFPFSGDTDSISISIDVELSPSAPSAGEPLDLFLRYLNATGDTVFSGGPVRVMATPSGPGAPPAQPVSVPLTYTGPGADATGVTIAPDTLTVIAGESFTFSATAVNAQLETVASPIVFRSLDTTIVTVSATGAGTSLPSRGMARVVSELVNEAGSDTGYVVVMPRPAALDIVSGNNQTAFAGEALAQPVRIRLVATDGLPIVGASLSVEMTTGSGEVVPTDPITNDDGIAEFNWTLGQENGTQVVTVSTPGLAGTIEVTATTGTPPLVPSQLIVTQNIGTQQTVGQTVVTPLIVEVHSEEGELVTWFTDSVYIELAENPYSAQLTGTVAVAAVGGVATFSDFSFNVPGENVSIYVTSDDLVPAMSADFDIQAAQGIIEVVSGNDQAGYISQPVFTPVAVRINDATGTPISDITVTFAVATGGGSITGGVVETNASGIATLESWTLGATPGINTLTASVDGFETVTITATGEVPPPAIDLSIFGSNVIGTDRSGTLNVRLLQPAPAGGLTVSVVSESPANLTIAAPGTIAFSQGEVLRTIDVNGLAIGTATVVASAPGYTPDTLLVPVSLNLISVPLTLNVPLSQSRGLPIQLSTPAPAGGVPVAVSSSNPAVAYPMADTVFVPAGQTTVNASIQGAGIGSAAITATNPNYALHMSQVSVTASLNIVESSVNLNGGFGGSVTVRLEGGGSPVAAPAGGIPITVTPVNAECATTVPEAMIGAGLVSTTLNIVYGGTAALPCQTYIRVDGPDGFVSDSVWANVAAFPSINRAATTLGAGLQRNIGASLSASNHGGVTVRVTSLDSSAVLVSPSTSVAGQGSFETVLLNGSASIPLVVSALSGVVDTVGVMIEAPGFITNTFEVHVWQPIFEINGLQANTNTLAVDDAFYVSVGIPATGEGTTIWWGDAVRAGGGPLTVRVVNDNPDVGTLATSSEVADTLFLTIAELQSNTPTSVAAGGAAFRSLNAGVTTVTASVDQMRAVPNSQIGVTVTAPAITLSANEYIGSGLRRSKQVNTPGSPAPEGGTTVTIFADRQGVVEFATGINNPGSDTIQVTIPQGSTSATFYVQGVEEITADTVQVTAIADGYTSASAAQMVWQSVYEINGLNGSGTTNTADDAFYVSVGTPTSPTGTSIWWSDAVRNSSVPYMVSVIVDDPSVGTLVLPDGSTADSIEIEIPTGATNTPTSLAAGGFAFRYLGAGTTTVRSVVTSSSARSVPGSTRTVTVSATSIGLPNDGLGSGLQRSRSVSINSPAPAGGAPITIHADRLGVIQFAPNATTIGMDTIVVTINEGATSASFFVQGVEGIVADTVTVTASSPGLTSANVQQAVYRGLIEVSGLPTSLNTMAPDDPFTVSVGTPSSQAGTFIWWADNIRFGGPPLTVTLRSSVPTVGQLTTLTRTGDSVTVEIPSGGRITPNTVALGGVAFQPLTAGSTAISASIPGFAQSPSAVATNVNITSPALSLSSVNVLGAGLQVSASGSLNAAQHGGVDVVVRSANPGLVRVAPSAGVEASDSIVISLPNGSTSFSYVVAAMDGVTGQTGITASATGFTDASTTSTVVAPGIDIASLSTSSHVMAADDAFVVRIGVPSSQMTALDFIQARRFGADPIAVTLTSTNPTVGALVTSTSVGSPITVEIAPGASSTPSTVAAGGVALRFLSPGTTNVSVSHPTIVTTLNTGNVNVNVTPPSLTLNAMPNVGAGLQTSATASTNAVRHEGMSIILTSSDPSRLLLSSASSTPATSSIQIDLPAGTTSFTYYFAGVEGNAGEVTVTATAVGHTQAVRAANVVTPMIQITGLVTSRAAGGADDPFQIQVGLPNVAGTAIGTLQLVRAGAGPLTATVSSSAPTVGELTTTAATGATITVEVPELASASPGTVAAGGIAFRYLTAGTSVVTVGHPNFTTASTNGIVTVTVLP